MIAQSYAFKISSIYVFKISSKQATILGIFRVLNVSVIKSNNQGFLIISSFINCSINKQTNNQSQLYIELTRHNVLQKDIREDQVAKK